MAVWRGATWGATMVALAAMLGACAPDMPRPPATGYQLVPRSSTVRLAEAGEAADTGAASLTPRQWVALGRLVAEAQAAGARQPALHLNGPLTQAQRVAVLGWVRSRLPGATVDFSGGGGALVARVDYREVAVDRCRPGPAWGGEDGLLPAGCAVELTFARMVADPDDLVEPKPMGPALLEPLARDALRYSQGDEQTGAAKATMTDMGAALSSAASAGAAGK